MEPILEVRVEELSSEDIVFRIENNLARFASLKLGQLSDQSTYKEVLEPYMQGNDSFGYLWNFFPHTVNNYKKFEGSSESLFDKMISYLEGKNIPHLLCAEINEEKIDFYLNHNFKPVGKDLFYLDIPSYQSK